MCQSVIRIYAQEEKSRFGPCNLPLKYGEAACLEQMVGTRPYERRSLLDAFDDSFLSLSGWVLLADYVAQS
jgi:hypothetical protein